MKRRIRRVGRPHSQNAIRLQDDDACSLWRVAAGQVQSPLAAVSERLWPTACLTRAGPRRRQPRVGRRPLCRSSQTRSDGVPEAPRAARASRQQRVGSGSSYVRANAAGVCQPVATPATRGRAHMFIGWLPAMGSSLPPTPVSPHSLQRLHLLWPATKLSIRTVPCCFCSTISIISAMHSFSLQQFSNAQLKQLRVRGPGKLTVVLLMPSTWAGLKARDACKGVSSLSLGEENF